jgi:chromosome segregation ATPase
VLALGSIDRKNPVAGVVKLLTKLQSKIMEEGKAEAAAYDKFACFCKENADDKHYSINKKGARIAELDASIKKLAAGIQTFTDKGAESTTKKEELEKANKAATEQRNKDFVEHTLKKKDVLGAIEEVLNATAAVKESGEKQESFLQDKHMADPGKASSYDFKGGDTLDKLSELHKKFKDDLKKLEEDESESKHSYNMEQGARGNELIAMKALIVKCQTLVGQKSQAKAEDESEKSELEGLKAEDEAFLEKLTEECEEKAVAWDARSKRRMNELTAMATALGFLKGDGVGKYGSAKLTLLRNQSHMKQNHTKRVGLLKTHAHVKKHGHWVWKPNAVSLMQIEDPIQKKAISHLAEEASILKSMKLEKLVMQIKDSPFDSVKKMIEDLITKIDAEQEAETAEIDDCKTDMIASTKKRAKNDAKMSTEQAKVETLSSKIDDHNEDIKELVAEVSEIYKSLNEATQLRKVEKKDNEVTISDATAGKSALDSAISVLKEFYDSEMELIQKKKEEPELNAPESSDFLGDEGGADPSKQNEATGILGLLGTIKEDYAETIEKTTDAEEDAEKQYNSYKTESEKEIADKENLKADLEKNVRKANADTEQAKEDYEDWSTQKDEAVRELNILTPRCSGLGAAAGEKKKRREEEKKALNDAIVIIETMGPADAPSL